MIFRHADLAERLLTHADLADLADEFIPQINHGPQMTPIDQIIFSVLIRVICGPLDIRAICAGLGYRMMNLRPFWI